MKLSTLVTTLLLAATTSAASAHPISVGYPSPAPAPVVRDHRVWQPEGSYPRNTRLGPDYSLYVGSRPYETIRWFRRPEWIPLTEPTRIDRSREVFFINNGPGPLTALRLFNNFGHSYIRMVSIEFADGGLPQFVRLDRSLDASITIDLAGRSRLVKKVIVYGSTARGSSYQLLGH